MSQQHSNADIKRFRMCFPSTLAENRQRDREDYTCNWLNSMIGKEASARPTLTDLCASSFSYESASPVKLSPADEPNQEPEERSLESGGMLARFKTKIRNKLPPLVAAASVVLAVYLSVEAHWVASGNVCVSSVDIKPV